MVRGLTPFRGRLAVIGLGLGISHQVSTALGHGHEGLGQLDRAEELYRESITQADDIGLPYFATVARRHLAQILHSQNPDDVEVPELCAWVVAKARRYGFADELREAQQLAAGG